MRRSTLLFSGALIALLVGSWPFLSRIYNYNIQRVEQDEQQQHLSVESARLKAELQAKKPALLAELKQLQADGLHQEVLAKTSRYWLANDPDIRALHRQSAQELSFQQTLSKLAGLAATYCNDTVVRHHLEQVMAAVQPQEAVSGSSTWTIQRLDTKAFIEPIQSQLRAAAAMVRSDGAHEHAHASDAASAAELFGVDHPPRLHPALAYLLLQGKTVDHQVCVWRVHGQAALGALTHNVLKPFELVVWMAASASERNMEFNVLSIQGF